MENAIAMFLNIHARFLFEKAFYEERSKGIVSEQRINELMVNAQKEAYGDCFIELSSAFLVQQITFLH